jgi:hypothetical protein
MEMKRVHIDNDGFMSDSSPEGEKAWLETYEKSYQKEQPEMMLKKPPIR